jgi:rhodanese-related sulfurtransferase
LILDIRDKIAFSHKHVEGSTNIDVYDDIHEGNYEIARQKLSKLPKDRIIMTVCNAGVTAQPASLILESMGYKTKVLKDGMAGWEYFNDIPLKL